MVSVEEAKILLMKNVKTLSQVQVNIANAVNSVLAANVFSHLHLPPFNQAAMDGYAIKLNRENKYRIIGEIKAGYKKNIELSKGEAVKIFTGAAVPDNANCVIMQEKTTVVKNEIHINKNEFKKNENIRLIGSQIKKGEIALKKGTILNPAAIGFISSLGIDKISVFKKPEVTIIVTGNELKKAGEELQRGQIYESNSLTLQAALHTMNLFAKNIFKSKDEKRNLSEKIAMALSISDVIIISGGISVGKYDLVKECLEENGVKKTFYKVSQKPGKPLFAGKKGKKIIFALPGNPAATLVCFYEYVYPAIRKLMGFSNYFLPSQKMKILNDVKKKNDRAYFLKGKITDVGVIPLDGQESYMLKSFSEANALIYLPIQTTEYKKGDSVEAHLF